MFGSSKKDQNMPENVAEPDDDANIGRTKKIKLLSFVSLKVLIAASSFFATSIVILAIFSSFFAKQIAEYKINQIFRDKSIDSKIIIKNIGLDGVAFSHISIGPKGKETIIAENGVIDWQADILGRKLIINNIRADKAFAHIAINKNGLDFRDLQSFLGKSSGDSLVEINNISLPNANLLIDTDYGVINNNISINGSKKQGFIGSSKTIIDNNMMGNPIIIGFAVEPIKADGDVALALSTIFNNNNLAFNKTQLSNIYGRVNSYFKLQNRGKKLYEFTIFPSNFSVGKVKFADLSIEGAGLNLKGFHLNSDEDWQNNAIISSNGAISFKNLNIKKSIIQNAQIGFDVFRQNKKVIIKTISNYAKIKSYENIDNLKLQTVTEFKPAKLDEFQDTDFKTNIYVIGNNINGKETNKILEHLKNIGLSIGSFANLKAKLLVVKENGAFFISPDKDIIINNGNIKFSDVSLNNNVSKSIIVLQNKLGKWSTLGKLYGSLFIKDGKGSLFDTKIDNLSFNNNYLSANIHDSNIVNFKYDKYRISGKINNLAFNKSANSLPNGEVLGAFHINSANHSFSDSFINLAGNVKNGHIFLKSSGSLNNINFSNINSKKAYYSLFANGFMNSQGIINNINLKSNLIGSFSNNGNYINNSIINYMAIIDKKYNDYSIKSFGNISASNLYFNGNKINKLHSDFVVNSDNIKSQNFIGKINAKIGFADLVNNIKSEDLAFSSQFNISNKNNILIANYDNLALSSPNIYSQNFSLKSANISGPIFVKIANKQLTVNSENCLKLNANNLQINGNFMPLFNGSICSDEKGRIASIINGKTNLYANTNIKNSYILLGNSKDKQKIEIANLNGKFVSGTNGEVIYNSNGGMFNIHIKSLNNNSTDSIINVNKSNINIIIDKLGTKLKAKIDQVSTNNFPVSASGPIAANILIPKNGKILGDFTFNNLKLKDNEKLPRFENILISGNGKINNNIINALGRITNEALSINIANFNFNHNLTNASGSLNINSDNLIFTPNYKDNKPFGIQDIIPPLQDVLVNADGKIDASTNIKWSGGKKLQGTAEVFTDNFNFYSLLGPVKGVSGRIKFSDIFAIKTDGVQNLKIASLNVGIPLNDGNIDFSIDGDKNINIHNALWPFSDGSLFLEPDKIPFYGNERKVTIYAKDVDMAKLLNTIKIPNIVVQGRMNGRLPVYIINNDVRVIDGTMSATEAGGIVKYTGPDINPPNKKLGFIDKIKQSIFGKPVPSGAQLAIEALRDLHYKILKADVNGRLAGDMNFKFLIEGNNPALLSGHGFKFNVGVNVPLGQLLQSYNNLLQSYKNVFEFDTKTIKKDNGGQYYYKPTEKYNK